MRRPYLNLPGMKPICLLLFLTIGFHINAQQNIDYFHTDPGISDKAKPWSNLNFNNDPDNFNFAIMPDRTGGHRSGILENAIDKLILLQPEFVVTVGDMIEGYSINESEIYQQWDIFNSFIAKLNMPFFYVPGNHDYTNLVMSRIWQNLYGPSYYYFVYKNVLFLCINTQENAVQGGKSGIGQDQFNYFREVLKDWPDVRWTVVFMHEPLWLNDDNGYWADIEAMLKTRKHTVFAGHTHHYVKYERNNGKYIILATAGGISELRGIDFGEFDEIAMVKMTDEGPVLANLLFQSIWDENVVTQELHEMVTTENIIVEPVFTDEDKFTSAEYRIMVSNEYNYPMWLYLNFDDNPILKPEIISYQKEIQPNSIQIIKLPVNTVFPADIKRIQPLMMKSYEVYKYKQNRQININSKFGIVPLKKEYCYFTNGKIWIDGIIDEWEGLAYRTDARLQKTDEAEGYSGDFDGSFEFDVRYDHENLYIGISVWDDKLMLDEKGSIWTQDVIRIYLDGRPLEISSNGRGKNESKDWLYINFAPSEGKRNQPNIFQKELLPPNTVIATKKTVAGFDAEISIPLSYLNFKNGAEWENFRINLAYVDWDEESSRTIIWWRPAWDSDDNWIGSGIFFKKRE
jgi:3',5'-cyclic AMP phosphodiesterase CpdA